MLDRIPRRLRFAFSKPASLSETEGDPVDERAGVDIVAYGEDCILSGRVVLDEDPLTEMLNDHEEYTLTGVTVERFDGGSPIEIDDVLVGRDELFLVHSSGPLGVVGLRWATAPRYVAVKMGPYRVRGFFHGPPGADPVDAIRRRKAMVPLSEVRIEYRLHGQPRETRVATVIMNRHQVEWIQPVETDREEFPPGPARVAPLPPLVAPVPEPLVSASTPDAASPTPPASSAKRRSTGTKRPTTSTKRPTTGTKRPTTRRPKSQAPDQS
jgi:hypothetical protein